MKIVKLSCSARAVLNVIKLVIYRINIYDVSSVSNTTFSLPVNYFTQNG